MDCNGIRADDAVGVEHRNGCVDLRGSVGVLVDHVVDVCCGAEEQAVGGDQRRVLGIRSYWCSSSIRVSYLKEEERYVGCAVFLLWVVERPPT